MKKQPETSIIKLSERFDKQLLNILSTDLNALRSVKNAEITALLPKRKARLLVA